MKVGTLCIKLAGREAGNKCVIVEIIDDTYVMIDGNVRRKKCNIAHLEPLAQTIDIKSKASHEDVVKAFKEMDIEIKEKRSKPKTERPRKIRKKVEDLDNKKKSKKTKDKPALKKTEESKKTQSKVSSKEETKDKEKSKSS